MPLQDGDQRVCERGCFLRAHSSSSPVSSRSQCYSRSHHGLLTVDTRLHYLWTYAPTLFFTIGKFMITTVIAISEI